MRLLAKSVPDPGCSPDRDQGRGGRGRGFGRGMDYSPDQERSWLEAALQSITERLDALKNDK